MLTPELLQKEAIAQWDGTFPPVIAGGNELPILNINTAPVSAAR